MRELRSFGWVITILHDEQLAIFQGATNLIAVGHRRQRIAADNPQCFKLASLRSFK